MKTEKDVINCISQIAEKMLSDKENIENYAAKLGYSINLQCNIDVMFNQKIKELFPVTNYLYYLPRENMKVNLKNAKALPKDIIFALVNPEIYLVNTFYNLIEKIDEKNLSIKIEKCSHYLLDMLNCFNISFIEENYLKNGKTIFQFDKENFDKAKSVIMYSNEYTDTAISRITEKEKTMYKEHCTYPEILSNFMSENEIEDNYKYINKYLLKLALMSK